MYEKIKVDFNNSGWIYFDKNGIPSVNAQSLYMYLKNNYSILITPTNNYLYDDGVYKKLSDVDFKAFIKQFIPVESRNKKQWEAVYEEFKTDFTLEEAIFNSDENIINFKNGVLNLTTNEVFPHSDKVLSTVQIPCNYIADSSLDSAPIFSKYLHDLIGDDEKTKQCILEYIGAILSNIPGYKFKKLLMLVGSGNTGKTQLREFVISLIVKQNNLSVDLKNLNDTFGTATLHNKRLAGCGDMSYARVNEINILKELTGGDDMLANQKYKPLFSFVFKGLLWYNCNKLPKFGGDTGKHVYDRFIIVNCNNVIPVEKRDSEILQKMLAEKDIVASVCIRYLKNAINRGYKFCESDSIIENRKHYETDNSSLFTFIEYYCQIGAGKTKRSEFNAEYFQWCRENKLHPEKQHDITKLLFEKYGIEARKSNNIYYDLTINTEHLQEEKYSYELLKNFAAEYAERRSRTN